ncbi:uncharacterized protein LOC119108609 [Pollicipes pollicipes]|uniref:uncharacterized protein LOC119108609 n=1 Tax=Pollicipes pollicipes TaxID=41117 RepID=UPI0018858E7E|nr:uncharacterized protein LOC119108609 [Pollicipes pollicipes]
MRCFVLVGALLAVAHAATVTKSSSAGGTSVDGSSVHRTEEVHSVVPDTSLGERFGSRRTSTKASRPRPTSGAIAPASVASPSSTAARPTSSLRPSSGVARPLLSPVSVPHVPAMPPINLHVPVLSGTLGTRFNSRGAAAKPAPGSLAAAQSKLNQIAGQLAAVQQALGV